MPLLQIEKLTMRFGGLTAVNAVELTVEPGQIFSVIGPNGAGKTTLFNAITGVYNPTEGKVRFDGKEQYRPLRWYNLLAFIACGAIFGVLFGLLSVNVDRLWLATVKKQSHPLDTGKLKTDFVDYFESNLLMEEARGGDRWKILYPNGENLIPSIDKKADAEKLFAALQEGKVPVVVKKDGDFFANFEGIEEPVFVGDEKDVGEEMKKLSEFQANRGARKFNGMLGLAIGGTLGLLGSFTVWRRGRRTTDYIALGGMARTFQNIRLFQNMTVMENVLIGLDRSLGKNPLRMALRTPGLRREEKAAEAKAMELLEFVNLHVAANNLAKNLPYGDQRRLEIARALACNPKLVLLDEPAAGMNPRETVDLMALIRRIRDTGVTVLLIEHHMNLVMGISDRIAVLDYGVKIAEGTAEEVRRNPKVIEAYLGKEEVT